MAVALQASPLTAEQHRHLRPGRPELGFWPTPASLFSPKAGCPCTPLFLTGVSWPPVPARLSALPRKAASLLDHESSQSWSLNARRSTLPIQAYRERTGSGGRGWRSLLEALGRWSPPLPSPSFPSPSSLSTGQTPENHVKNNGGLGGVGPVVSDELTALRKLPWKMEVVGRGCGVGCRVPARGTGTQVPSATSRPLGALLGEVGSFPVRLGLQLTPP